MKISTSNLNLSFHHASLQTKSSQKWKQQLYLFIFSDTNLNYISEAATDG